MWAVVGEFLGLGCSCTHDDCSFNRFVVHFLHPKKSTKGEISGVSSFFGGVSFVGLGLSKNVKDIYSNLGCS